MTAPRSKITTSVANRLIQEKNLSIFHLLSGSAIQSPTMLPGYTGSQNFQISNRNGCESNFRSAELHYPSAGEYQVLAEGSAVRPTRNSANFSIPAPRLRGAGATHESARQSNAEIRRTVAPSDNSLLDQHSKKKYLGSDERKH